MQLEEKREMKSLSNDKLQISQLQIETSQKQMNILYQIETMDKNEYLFTG